MQVDISIAFLTLSGLLCQQSYAFNGPLFFILFLYLHLCNLP